MKKRNSTFCQGKPTNANACVGNNGSPSYFEYSEGFSKAANMIIDLVLSSEEIHMIIDEMVYPVCFNMRHSVELTLKGAIEDLEKLPHLKQTKQNPDSNSHDIKNIWLFFKNKSENFDTRYKAINERIEPTILDIAAVDATGQTFRYPKDKNSQKHLHYVVLSILKS